ncbi:OmpW family outer membrane protein [Thalassomonas sp. M1454]|uniref:OmpW family outer membrane protein n=1 Tax=Thalassomonas sp. M1454 TaxID=2594477 RepID=UPI00163D5D63|nr:OmpW family outer membrane protein [Thalassomonas sp. M1454]
MGDTYFFVAYDHSADKDIDGYRVGAKVFDKRDDFSATVTFWVNNDPLFEQHNNEYYPTYNVNYFSSQKPEDNISIELSAQYYLQNSSVFTPYFGLGVFSDLFAFMFIAASGDNLDCEDCEHEFHIGVSAELGVDIKVTQQLLVNAYHRETFFALNGGRDYSSQGLGLSFQF